MCLQSSHNCVVECSQNVSETTAWNISFAQPCRTTSFQSHRPLHKLTDREGDHRYPHALICTVNGGGVEKVEIGKVNRCTEVHIRMPQRLRERPKGKPHCRIVCPVLSASRRGVELEPPPAELRVRGPSIKEVCIISWVLDPLPPCNIYRK